MEDVELWLVWPLLGQEGKVPEPQSIVNVRGIVFTILVIVKEL